MQLFSARAEYWSWRSGTDMNLPPLLGRRFQIDFGLRGSQIPLMAWLLVVAGFLSVALAWIDLAPGWARHQQLRAERLALEEQLNAVAQSGARMTKATSSSEDEDRVRAWIGELGRPWDGLFHRFESIQVPKVYLVQLVVDSRFHDVQLLAEAPGLDDVLTYSKQLESDDLIQGVRLTHHEWRNAPGARVVVASLTAELGHGAGARGP